MRRTHLIELDGRKFKKSTRVGIECADHLLLNRPGLASRRARSPSVRSEYVLFRTETALATLSPGRRIRLDVEKPEELCKKF